MSDDSGTLGRKGPDAAGVIEMVMSRYQIPDGLAGNQFARFGDYGKASVL
jgi:hypothetical protein